MGMIYKERCKECGFEFVVRTGGGFVFELLRCDTCGETRSVNHKDIGEPFRRYAGGPHGPFAFLTMERDEATQAEYSAEPMTREEYHSAVEEILGECSCGGKYRFNAPPRCKRCRSTDLEGRGDWKCGPGSVICYID